MRERCNEGRMTVDGSIRPGIARLCRSADLAERLTERACFWIKVLDWHRARGQNISLTARHFGLGRSIPHRWWQRFHRAGLLGLCDQSRQLQQNSYVEISHGANEREFCRQGNVCSSLAVMQQKIIKWAEIWNYFRPHQALSQLTPAEYSARLKIKGLPTRDIIIL